MIPALIVLHVLAATIWTGGHLVLSLTVLPRAMRAGDPGVIARFEHGYEKIGVPALLVQIVTGFALLFHHLPDMAAWFDFTNPKAPWIVAKLVLLAATVGLALHARLRVLPDLQADRLRALAWHVVPVTVIAVLLVVAGLGIRTNGFASY